MIYVYLCVFTHNCVYIHIFVCINTYGKPCRKSLGSIWTKKWSKVIIFDDKHDGNFMCYQNPIRLVEIADRHMTRISVCIYVYYTYICVQIRIFVCIYAYLCAYTYIIYVYLCVFTCICVYILIFVCINTCGKTCR